MRMAVLRDWDAICEEGNERVLESEVMEEEVMFMNVLFSMPNRPLRGATE